MLTLQSVHGKRIIMKTKTVKTYIKRLLMLFNDYKGVAKTLGVTPRYIRHLEKGERIPSEHLRKLIKIILKIKRN